MKRFIAIIGLIFCSFILMAATTTTTDIITKGPWVDSRSSATLQAAADYAASTGKGLQISTGYTITSNMTFSCPVKVLSGNTVTIASAQTVSFTKGFEGTDNAISCSTTTCVYFSPGSIERIYSKWFSVKGDGVTDDTIAVKAAISSLNSSGELVYSGTILTSATITATRIQLTAKGKTGTIVLDRPSNYFLKSSSLNGAALVLGSNTIMNGGGVVAQNGNGGDNIVVLGNNAYLSHVYSEGAGNDNFRVGNDAGTINSNIWKFDHCFSQSAGRDGFYISSGTSPSPPDANAGIADTCTAQNSVQHGFHVGNADMNTFINCLGESNSGKGIELDNAMNTTIVGGDYEANASGIDIHVNAGNTYTSILNSYGTTSDLGTMTVRGYRNVSTQSSWTPTIRGLTAAGANSYSAQTGWWEREGSVIHAQAYVAMSAKDGTMSGDVAIAGLPVIMDSGFGATAFAACSIAQYSNVTLTTNYHQLGCRVGSNNSYLNVIQSGSGQAALALPVSALTATTHFIINVTYPVLKY